MALAASWADLGYGKIELNAAGTPRQPHVDRALAALFRDHVNYEVNDDSSGIWIRDPYRVKGCTLRDAAHIEFVIDSNNSTDASSYGAVALVASSEYGRLSASKTPLASFRSSYESFQTDPRSAKGFYDLAYAVANCPISDLSTFLQNDVSPAFFQAFPNGRIVLVCTNYDFERRQGAVRGAYTLAQYDVTALSQMPGLQSFHDWQILAPFTQLRNTLDLGAIALFPTLPYFTAARPGIIVAFVPGELVEQTQPDFPAGWLDVYRSRWDFAREPFAGVPNVTAAGLSQPYSVYRRFLQVGGFESTTVIRWLEWLVRRFNDFALQSTDPTNFNKCGKIDFITCFEHGLSTDRLLRKAMSAQVSSELSVRKYATFEIADIVDELFQYWTQSQPTDRFKALFNPKIAVPIFSNALSTAPEPIREMLTSGVDSIYDSLRGIIIDSVFVKTKLTGTGGVLVRDRSLASEHEETADDFTANVVRALRNTHHGYMTVRDRHNRPSRYLALVTGALPDTLPYIGVIVGLALLADPRTLFGRPCYPKAVYS